MCEHERESRPLTAATAAALTVLALALAPPAAGLGPGAMVALLLRRPGRPASAAPSAPRPGARPAATALGASNMGSTADDDRSWSHPANVAHKGGVSPSQGQPGIWLWRVPEEHAAMRPLCTTAPHANYVCTISAAAAAQESNGRTPGARACRPHTTSIGAVEWRALIELKRTRPLCFI